MAGGECLGIVGVGLIGGSVGLAARRTGRFATILGVDRDKVSLENAKSRGCIDGYDELAAVAERAHVLVVCAPVNHIGRLVLQAIPTSRVDALLTDVGSTKRAIVGRVHKVAHSSVRFVGAHPLTGAEKGGPLHARADLFDDRLTVLTPIEGNAPETLEMAQTFWKSLGCRTVTMTPEEHDRTLAFTSHLPHLISAALAGTLRNDLRSFCASGFRDMTRLAGGDPDLWTAILVQNHDNILVALNALHVRLNEFRDALQLDPNELPNEMEERIRRLLTEAKGVRDDLGS